jgi:hypothetical protein
MYRCNATITKLHSAVFFRNMNREPDDWVPKCPLCGREDYHKHERILKSYNCHRCHRPCVQRSPTSWKCLFCGIGTCFETKVWNYRPPSVV